MSKRSPERDAAIEAKWLARETAFVREHGCSREEHSDRKSTMEVMRSAYNAQKSRAKRKGIDWKFDLAGWVDFWLSSGKWERRGSSGYVMCRKRDKGPYSRENCYIGTFIDNCKDRVRWGKSKGLTIYQNDTK